MLQLPGHFKGRALQEWNLLEEVDKNSYNRAVVALGNQLDTGSKVIASPRLPSLGPG